MSASRVIDAGSEIHFSAQAQQNPSARALIFQARKTLLA